MFEYALGDIIKHCPPLHDHHTRRNLVGPVSLCKLLHRQCPEPMYAHCRHRYVPSVAAVSPQRVDTQGLCGGPGVAIQPRPAPQRPELDRREPRRSTHGKFGCFVDEATDIGYRAEGAWVDGWGSGFTWERWGKRRRRGRRKREGLYGVGGKCGRFWPRAGGITEDVVASVPSFARGNGSCRRQERVVRCREGRWIQVQNEQGFQQFKRQLQPGALKED